MASNTNVNVTAPGDLKQQIKTATAAEKWELVAQLSAQLQREEAVNKKDEIDAELDELCRQLGPVLEEATTIQLTLESGLLKRKRDTVKLDILREKLGIGQSAELTYEELERRTSDMVIGQAREIAAQQFDSSAEDDFSERLKLKVEAVEKLLAENKYAASRFEIIKKKVKNRLIKCLKRIA